MPASVLATKLFIPPARPGLVSRPRLKAQLSDGRGRQLTLVSAPAGFGKTTLVSDWIDSLRRPSDRLEVPPSQPSAPLPQIAWLALDRGDNDPRRFLTYFVAALQTIAPETGARVLSMLQAPQPPAPEAILGTLINDIAAIPDEFVLVLDDYHAIEAKAVDDILAFLVEYMPPRMHLTITTREDPPIPLARLRARGQLTEIRAADLRFTPDEAATFLNQAVGLTLSPEQVAALDARTEGWIAGLQLAALSMQGSRHDPVDFIHSFTGSHRFVMDYLVEEVLQQQTPAVQSFLLRTSVLERMCGPLCATVIGDAVVGDAADGDGSAAQAMLEFLERANLFLIPLDNTRRWYRYHHLFADLLRQRLAQQVAESTAPDAPTVAGYHMRASRWYADHGFELDAFHHATAAHDVAQAIRLIEGKGMPLQFRGGATPILAWLQSLSRDVLDAHPVLWITWGSALLMLGQVVGVEEKAAAAEAVLHDAEPTPRNRDLIGRIASLRTTIAVTRHDVEGIIAQSQRALAYLSADNLPVRASINWALGNAYRLKGDRAAAATSYATALDACKAVGHTVIAMMATLGLGIVTEQENDLHRAHAIYQDAVHLVGDAATPPICDAYLGMARIQYQWNDLELAEAYGRKSLEYAQQIKNTDRSLHCLNLLAQVKRAHGDVDGAAAMLADAAQVARREQFAFVLPDIVTAQVATMLRQGDVAAAAQLSQAHNLPLSQARTEMAQGHAAAALARLDTAQQAAAARHWADEQLKILVLQALARHRNGDGDAAARTLGEALAAAEPHGFIRLFVDEGAPMRHLLTIAAKRHDAPAIYTDKLLAAFQAEPSAARGSAPAPQPLIDPLSERELEILALIAQGLKNQEIADQLFISLNTVLYHTKNIYGKLGVNKRAKAIMKARELGLGET